MRLKLSILAGAMLTSIVSLSANAESDSMHESIAQEEESMAFVRIRIGNAKEVSLGRITDLSVDLRNGRIVEMFVASDRLNKADPATGAGPARPWMREHPLEVHQFVVRDEASKSASPIDFLKMLYANRDDRVTMVNRVFGQEPYFLEQRAPPSTTANRRKMLFDSVARSSMALRAMVGNLQGQQAGEVYVMTFDIPNHRIRSFAVFESGDFENKNAESAMTVHSDALRPAIILGESKQPN